MVNATQTAEAADVLLTSEQLAERWSVSPGTLQNWRLASKGPAYIRIGGGLRSPVRYRLRDIEVYEQEHIIRPRRGA
jgi:hypothetical protein